MTNSLSLKQCHFVGQSSILFPKYIYESFQGLYNPDRIRFLSLIRGSYSYGEGTGLRPGMRTAAAPLATRSNDAQRRHALFPFKTRKNMQIAKTFLINFSKRLDFYVKLM